MANENLSILAQTLQALSRMNQNKVSGEKGKEKPKIEDFLNPLQENDLKTVKKVRSKQIEEAMEQHGVPAENILKTSGIPLQDQTQSAIVPQQQTQQGLTDIQKQIQQLIKPATGPLGKFLEAGGVGVKTKAQQLQNLLQAQKGLGQQPLQAGDRELFDLTSDRELAKQSLKDIKEIEKAGSLDANQIFTKFEPIANNHQSMIDSFARLKASAQDPSAAGDLALIFNYMKMLDPASVVRESEFANAAATGALGERFIAVGKKLASGKRLSDNMRIDFLDRGKRLFKTKKQNFKFVRNQYKNIARKNNIDTSRILREVRDVSGKQEDEDYQKYLGIVGGE